MSKPAWGSCAGCSEWYPSWCLCLSVGLALSFLSKIFFVSDWFEVLALGLCFIWSINLQFRMGYWICLTKIGYNSDNRLLSYLSGTQPFINGEGEHHSNLYTFLEMVNSVSTPEVSLRLGRWGKRISSWIVRHETSDKFSVSAAIVRSNIRNTLYTSISAQNRPEVRYELYNTKDPSRWIWYVNILKAGAFNVEECIGEVIVNTKEGDDRMCLHPLFWNWKPDYASASSWKIASIYRVIL